MRRWLTGLVSLVVSLGGLLAAAPGAQAAYPGRNGRIAYVQGTHCNAYSCYGPGNIKTVNPDGSGGKQLTRSGTDRHPQWSPDGRWIAFERSKDIFVMTTAGTSVRRVTSTGRAHWPTWSPDGKRLAFVNIFPNGHGDIFSVAVSGGAIIRMTFDAASTCGDDYPDWSPNGNLIVYHQSLGTSCLQDRLLLLNVATGKTRVMALPKLYGGAFDWLTKAEFTPDGTRIAFSGYAGLHGVWTVTLRGAGITELYSSCECEGDPSFHDFAVSPDGRAVVLAENYGREDFNASDVWIVGQERNLLENTDRRDVFNDLDWQPI